MSFITNLFKPQKAPDPIAPPPLPIVSDAANQAKNDVAKKRKTSFLQGGNTDVTRGQALVPEANIGKKTLGGD